MYSDAVGDVPKGSIGGLVHADTRFLSRWALTIDGAPFLVLRGGTVDYYSAEFFLTNPRLEGLEANSVGLRRLRFVGNGLHERLELESYLDEPVRIELRLAVDNDFADLFEIKDKVRDRSDQIVRTPAPDRSGLTFRYTNETFVAETTIEVSAAATRIDGDGLTWVIDLPPRGTLDLRASRPAQARPARAPADARRLRRRVRPRSRRSLHGLARPAAPARDRLAPARRGGRSDGARPDRAPDRGQVRRRDDQAARGRAALVPDPVRSRHAAHRLPDGGLRAGPRQGRAARAGRLPGDRERRLPGHGARQDPPRAADGRAHPARAQAAQPVLRQRRLDAAVADPAVRVLALDGRRRSWSARCATTPWRRWPGSTSPAIATATATSSTGRARRRGSATSAGATRTTASCSPTGRSRSCRSRRPRSRATSTTPSFGWPSWPTGRTPTPALATRLRSEAAALRERFERDFWIDARGGYYAIGLDGDKRQIDSLTSNIGQLLWTGIVSEERAAIVARQLMSDALFSGWGVRTLSTDDEGFNPIGYHRGTVWPHDNSIIAYGLARYGFRDEANRIALAMLEAAAFSGYRLPEAFSGYPRRARPLPRPVPDGVQPAGLGDRGAAPPAAGDARPRGARRAGHARSGAARRDRPGLDPRPPGVRHALGRRGDRPERPRPPRPRVEGRPGRGERAIPRACGGGSSPRSRRSGGGRALRRVPARVSWSVWTSPVSSVARTSMLCRPGGSRPRERATGPRSPSRSAA